MKTFLVEVKPRARMNRVVDNRQRRQYSGVDFTVHVTALPEAGRANEAVRKALARHWGIAPSLISIDTGRSSRVKRITIDE